MPRTIGIISGSGIYPQTFIDAAREKAPDARLVMAAFKGETCEELADQANACAWFRVGQLGKMIKFLGKEGATEAVMVGQIAPRNLFDLRPDIRTAMLLARLKQKNAESIFGAIAEELAKDGITLLPATTFLEDIMPSEGHVCGPALKDSAIEDAQYGFQIAKETSRLDIGQTVVVRNGTVLAVEAFEGTNACIRRGGELGKGKEVTLAKVSKPNQDFRFDVPVVGPDTVKNCAKSGIGVIAIEANKTLLLGGDDVMALCNEHKVSIVALV
ncbi:MAG: UDP-2,3-diacylglucosamine diphosphatase LpxI [Verrucomicrobiae bacterium]|nr:UDP-2,3-diacylglucosamine diphosphatase LpxI [Verrucomicrobiae bacterium]NNJ43746.1 LpxI family protein [Akkermansiaceae bacterium]